MQKASIKIKSNKITRKDIKSNLKNVTIDNFDRMLNIAIYAFRVKQSLYIRGELSPKGFLYNDDIYSLNLGKKSGKGELLIADHIIEIFDRFKIADDFASKGDALTAFLLDHDDIFYTYFENKYKDKDINEEDYVVQFNESYNRMSALLLNYDVSNYISSDPKLDKELNKFINKKSK